MLEKYKIGKKIVSLDIYDLEKLSDNLSLEGTVYKYNNQIIKIFHEKRKSYADCLNENGLIYLSKLKTKKFNLTNEMIYDKNDNFIGYTANLIENRIPIAKINHKPIKKVLKELYKLLDDIILLSNSYVKVNDIHHNYMYNGGINIIDPGLYKVYFNHNYFLNLKTKLYKENLYEINIFLIRLLLMNKYENENFYLYKSKLIAKEFIEQNFENYNFFGDFLANEIKKYDIKNLNDYEDKMKKFILSSKYFK